MIFGRSTIITVFCVLLTVKDVSTIHAHFILFHHVLRYLSFARTYMSSVPTTCANATSFCTSCLRMIFSLFFLLQPPLTRHVARISGPLTTGFFPSTLRRCAPSFLSRKGHVALFPRRLASNWAMMLICALGS